VLLSLLYRLVRCLFGLLALLVRSGLSKDVELLVLRYENQVPRRQLSGRLRWDHADRLWLAALSRLVSRRRWPEIFPVTPVLSCTGTGTSSPASGPTPAGDGQDGPPPGPR
jgi:putative transposase